MEAAVRGLTHPTCGPGHRSAHTRVSSLPFSDGSEVVPPGPLAPIIAYLHPIAAIGAFFQEKKDCLFPGRMGRQGQTNQIKADASAFKTF